MKKTHQSKQNKTFNILLLLVLLTIISCSKNSQEFTDIINKEQTKDTDKDGVFDNVEKIDGTDPLKADSDGDGVNDGVEKTDGTDPLKSDSDSDGVNDGEEKVNNTDPTNSDSDSDSVNDGDEKTDGTDPLKADSDGDGLKDGEEKTNKTNPLNSDSDGDGVIDGTEKNDATDPLDNCSFVLNNQTETPDNTWNNANCDSDNFTNLEEIENGTNPLVFDEEIIIPPTPLEIGTWALTSASVENGIATTTVSGIDLEIPYEATSTNEDAQITLSQNLNTIVSTGTYTALLKFTVLGTDYDEEIISDSPLESGTWEIENNELIINANETTNGNYKIVELTETTLKLETEINRIVTAGGADLDTRGTIVLTFTRQ